MIVMKHRFFFYFEQMLSKSAVIIVLFFYQLMTWSMTESFSPQEAYKQLVDLVKSPNKPKGIPFSERIPSPKCLNDRIAIVGAGPSGIHMAYLLKKKGFQNIVVFEKNEGIGENSCTVVLRDTLPDMNTCYVQPDVGNNVIELARTFGLLESAKLSFFNAPSDQLSTSVNYSSYILTEAMKLNDPKIAVQKLFAAITDYIRLHRELFGKYYGALMRKPHPKVMKILNCTFLEFIEKYYLTLLNPLLVMSKTGGYGYADDVSALYGLMWNTPNRLIGCAAGIFEKKASSYPIESGLQKLWETLKTSQKIDVRFTVKISQIVRRNDKVLINFSTSKKWEEFDFLIWTSNLHLIEARELDKRIFSKSTFPWSTIMLDESLHGHFDHEASNIWLTAIEKKREPTCEDGSRSGGTDGSCTRSGTTNQHGKEKTEEPTLSEIFQKHFTGMNASEIEEIQREMCTHFLRFSPQDMAAGILWDIFDIQGSRRTWFAGSSVVLDSVQSVLEYNIQLVSKMTESFYC